MPADGTDGSRGPWDHLVTVRSVALDTRRTRTVGSRRKREWPVADQRSSNSRLLAIGFAVLVIGVALVFVVIRTGDDDPAAPAQVADPGATATETATEAETPLTPEQLSTARLPLPLEVPDDAEALAVRVNFARSVAAIPSPGDLVNIYRLPQPTADTPTEAGTEAPSSPFGSALPAPGPDSEKVLDAVEVLAVTGPLPAANDGTLTFVLAVDPGEVPGLMSLANDDELWFTLLPEVDDETEAATDEATEAPA